MKAKLNVEKLKRTTIINNIIYVKSFYTSSTILHIYQTANDVTKHCFNAAQFTESFVWQIVHAILVFKSKR